MYLYGASGHCKVIIDIINELKQKTITAVIDDNPKFHLICNIPVFNIKTVQSFIDKELIIAIGDNKIRKRIVNDTLANYINAVHPKAIVSIHAKIEEGTVVMAGVIINSGSSIGKHCIVNTGAIIEHDCQISDYVHICPNVSIAGSVIINEGTQVGIGATIIQGIEIGKWVMIGAGAVIINDVPDYAVVVGNPGKVIKFNV
ncbi:acetyltransferase [Flavobacterium sp.]|uniref:acetyltransferase n=1 Tax=Flavobacterium sp. TaxID=239 RepID=UPI0037532E95